MSRHVWLAFNADYPTTSMRSFQAIEDAHKYVNAFAAGEVWRTDKYSEEIRDEAGVASSVQTYGRWVVMSSKNKKRCRCQRK